MEPAQNQQPPESSSTPPTTDVAVEEEESTSTIDIPPHSPQNKNGVTAQHFAAYGFYDAIDEPSAYTSGAKGGDISAGGGKAKKKKSRTQNVVYGMMDDLDNDFDNDFDQDYIADIESEVLEEEEEEEEEEVMDDATEYVEESDDDNNAFWQDAFDEEMDAEELEELERQAELAAEAERIRIRNIRIAKIMKRKELLIEHYLRTARVMIRHRKKNIYLQDYLYQLAARKGVLRGDPTSQQQEEAPEEEEVKPVKKKRRRKKKKLEEQPVPVAPSDVQLKTPPASHTSQMVTKRKSKPKLEEKKKGPPTYKVQARKNRAKRLTIEEVLQKKAQITIRKVLRNVQDALNRFEHHRCKLKRQARIRKIANILERQLAGTPLLEQEGSQAVLDQTDQGQGQTAEKDKNCQAKKPSIQPKYSSGKNMDRQWEKSLKRIRELRLKQADREQEHRLQLLQKVQEWNTWEKDTLECLDTVHEFITTMAGRAGMTKRESESFDLGMEQFKRELFGLFEAMHHQFVRLCKAKFFLFMLERKVQDAAVSSSSSSAKSFSLADYERMRVENHEGHVKLQERQAHLIEQHTKLQRYIGKVTDVHTNKQQFWSVLRAGRHDLKQLQDLCLIERDNLIRKFKEIRKMKRIQRRMFIRVAVVQDRRIYKGYQRTNYNVRNLLEQKRILLTDFYRERSHKRVFNVRMDDIERRLNEAYEEQEEDTTITEIKDFKRTMQTRYNPKMPNTFHSVNMKSKQSIEKLIVPEKPSSRSHLADTTLTQVDNVPRSSLNTSLSIDEKKSSKIKKPRLRFSSIAPAAN